MGYEEYNVLIVDDDKKFAESLKAGITRSGFRCYVVHSPEEALSYTKLQDVHVIFVDCMLPKMNGLELVHKLKQSTSGTPHLFLMSGIFKDKQFINTSMKKTDAHEFLTKPFDIKTVINKLESLFSGVDESEDSFNPIVRLYLNRKLTARKIIKLINSAEGLHNFDLPWVFKILMDSKATGHLNIACTNGDIAGVGFSRGNIVQVNIKNEASLLGILLVEQGYLERSDLNEALENNNNHKRIGQYLVEHNLVSPHAITIVLKEQLIWRLKRLIADSQMELNFVKSEDIATIATVSDSDFSQFVLETIENTIRPDWLKTHYLPLGENLIAIHDEKINELNQARMFPYISRNYPSFEALLSRGTTLNELLANNPSLENNALKVIHFFNIMGFIEIRNVSKTLNYSHQAKRLQKLQSELENKTYFERLGVSPSAKESDIRKAYFDLAKVLHPDKLEDKVPTQIKELSEKVFEKIQVAYDTLKKADRKEKYLEDLEVNQSEKIMQGDQLFDVGKNFLEKGQFSQAKRQMQKALQLNPDSPDIRIHFLWADLKSTTNPSEGFLADVDKKLNLIPLESRDSAAYYHVRGLYYKVSQDNERARKYFETALNIDNTFISARREISLLTSKKEPVSLLTADLKDVVGLLFKK